MEKQPFAVRGGSEMFDYWGGVTNSRGKVTFAGVSLPHYMSYYFHLPIDPFHCPKLKNNSYSRSTVMAVPHFWTQYGPLIPNNFFWKIIIILIYVLAPFIMQNLKKKIIQRIQSYEDVQCLGRKWPITRNENFFREPDNEPCFFHSCLYTCQKLKSDVNLLVKYCWLKNTEISLAESHFCL